MLKLVLLFENIFVLMTSYTEIERFRWTLVRFELEDVHLA